MKDWRKWEIRKIDFDDPLFPDCLKGIKPKVKQLYFRGNWEVSLLNKTVAIVGSRRMTRYGRETTTKLVADLVGSKVTIISGFMYGVDTEAHRQCIDLGGRTVAVMGGGLDYLVVPENDELYTQILESGGLAISEYEPDFLPTLWSFPQRNRIVAGLATLGVMVVEAGIKSGSLITAELARKQGQEVWAIPGPINSSVSAGCNWLIKNGRAKMLLDPAEITGKRERGQQELGLEMVDPKEKEIVGLLITEALSIDELARKLSKSVAEVGVTISMMQMNGVIEDEGGRFYLGSDSKSTIL